jgi:carbamoyl-phosphate synthase small subunit
MNAVICTDGTSIDLLKASLADVPDMKGFELAKFPLRNHIFMEMNGTHRIAVLDLGIKRNILRNLAKRDCYMKIFPLMQLMMI